MVKINSRSLTKSIKFFSTAHTVSSSSCSSSWASKYSSASSSSFNSLLFCAPAPFSGSESKLKVKKLYASSAEGKSFWTYKKKTRILLYDIYNKSRASESIFPLIIAITACTNTCHRITISSQIELTEMLKLTNIFKWDEIFCCYTIISWNISCNAL